MIVIVDYGMGNLASIQNMIKKAGGRALVTSKPEDVEQAKRLILPGVGAFDAGMKNLAGCGLVPLLAKKVLEQKTPILGICLGMQLLTKRSEEGKLPGLSWIEGEAVHFEKSDESNNLKIPHMGWNTLKIVKQHPYLTGFDEEPRFYFVHSYHVVCSQNEIVAKTSHGREFVSVLGKDNIVGVQFHPEKSHKYGLQLFRNFLS